LEDKKFGDSLAGCVRVQFEKSFLVAGGLHYRQPVRGEAFFVEVAQVEEQLQVYVHEARDVFGALDVTSHPVKRMCDAA
jgi:hypothetical protein